jgi:hypothetical protein
MLKIIIVIVSFFLVPKDEWQGEDEDVTFHLFATKVENNDISLLLACGDILLL